ncbi:MAG: DUF3098 domain-containing protein [Sphingobacteriales bacterium]|nr:MAG: DUF3098 domain-containing protein [Sphingobacteriales bacterium]
MSTIRPTASTTTRTTTTRVKSNAPLGNQTFLFDKSNYMWMLIGVAVLLLGFLLMSGGKSANPHEFKYEEIYSTRRITIAPLLVLIGFAIEVYAIMKKPAVIVTEEKSAL